MKNAGFLIFDCEIKHGVITPNNPAQPGYRYADGWDDYHGMGISVCGVLDTFGARAWHVFCDDNIDEFAKLAKKRHAIVGWNNHRFDNPLLKANGVNLDGIRSIDIAEIFWDACGIETGHHPKELGLDATCIANGVVGKTGLGKEAPQKWQDRKFGQVIEYCLDDVKSTWQLFYEILKNEALINPVTGKKVEVRIPNVY